MVVATSGLNAGFIIVFSIFVVAFIGLLVYIAVWAIRRDVANRRVWQEQQHEAGGSPPGQ
jgi:hypothetical protein